MGRNKLATPTSVYYFRLTKTDIKEAKKKKQEFLKLGYKPVHIDTQILHLGIKAFEESIKK